jgi:hypothetical protein
MFRSRRVLAQKQVLLRQQLHRRVWQAARQLQAGAPPAVAPVRGDIPSAGQDQGAGGVFHATPSDDRINELLVELPAGAALAGTGAALASQPAAAAVAAEEEGLPGGSLGAKQLLEVLRPVDDIIRYMSFQAAWIKVMNKVMAAARATLRSECQVRQEPLAWVK